MVRTTVLPRLIPRVGEGGRGQGLYGYLHCSYNTAVISVPVTLSSDTKALNQGGPLNYRGSPGHQVEAELKTQKKPGINPLTRTDLVVLEPIGPA